MSAGKLNLFLEQGVTWRLPLLWRQPSPDGGATPGDPYDLSGAAAKMALRSIVGGRLFCQIDESSGIELGGIEGTLGLTLSAEQTGKVDETDGVYDLIVIFPGGDVVRLLEGTVSCDLAVTV